MASNGREDDNHSSAAKHFFLTAEFFETVERVARISLNVNMRSELDRAYSAAFLSVFSRRATTTKAANALSDLSEKAKAFLTAFNKIERNFPGLLFDIKDHATDESPDQILPWVPHKRALLDVDVWSGVIACMLILASGSNAKSKNIRKMVPIGKQGARRHVKRDALIITAIRAYRTAGGAPAIGGSLEGPLPRFLTELYNWFPKEIRDEIATTDKAFVGRAREILNEDAREGGQ
jgi:hypothetical protein